MIRYARPEPPDDFDERTRRPREQIAAAMAAGEPVDWKKHFLWSDYKDRFVAAQYFKCGWCEAHCSNCTGGGDVEHYAPKGRVAALAEAGVEVPHGVKVVGRNTPALSGCGYWWLAYDWDNWFLACPICNRDWKGELFPVEEEPHPPRKPGPWQPVPLLLHPFRDPDPQTELWFDESGAARSLSLRGRHTIDVCGLDRLNLREERRKVIREVDPACDIVIATPANAQGRVSLIDRLDCLHRHALPDHAYAATARSRILSRLGIHWNALPLEAHRLEIVIYCQELLDGVLSETLPPETFDAKMVQLVALHPDLAPLLRRRVAAQLLS